MENKDDDDDDETKLTLAVTNLVLLTPDKI
jgi:hypothetical protein